MLVSTKGRYALRVMVDLAEHQAAGRIPLKEIAARQGISEKYLENILATLVRANMLSGMRGKGGGYVLTRPPEQYTVGEILRLTEGRSKAGDGDADAQQVDRQVTRELKHKAVDDKLENAQRNDRERQRDDREERFDERIDNVQEQSHKGKADPGLGKAEGLDTGDEERGDRDGDRGEEPVKHKAHGVNPFLRRDC